jgi:4-amino-4-deoxy-L-arabinose transferase-like glycosyltransferase
VGDRRRRDLIVLAAVAIAVRLPAVLSSRHLSFDDGVYGSTAVAMRHGARPYTDVFSSQGPLHHPMLYVADLVGGRTTYAPRLLALAAGVVITLATYLAARAVADRRAALVAAILATTSGSVLLVTTGISGDGPAVAFAISAVAVALSSRASPGLLRPVMAGLLVGAACSVKLLAAPVAVPVGLCLLARGRPRRVVAAALAALAVPLVAAAPWGYERVWDQSVRYHQEARRYTPGEVVVRIVTTLVERDAFVVVTVVVVLVGALLARGRWHPSDGRWFARPGTWFGAWLACQVVVLLVESGMWRPHVSQLVVPLCLLAALRLPSWRTLAVAWVVAVPVWTVHVDGIVRPGGYRGGDAVLATRLRTLPDDAFVVTDEPGFAWRTGNRVPEAFVDVSVKQFDHDRITKREVLDEARAPRACAVLVTSDERLGRWPDLPDRLADDGYRTVLHRGETLLLVRPCEQNQ